MVDQRGVRDREMITRTIMGAADIGIGTTETTDAEATIAEAMPAVMVTMNDRRGGHHVPDGLVETGIEAETEKEIETEKVDPIATIIIIIITITTEGATVTIGIQVENGNTKHGLPSRPLL